MLSLAGEIEDLKREGILSHERGAQLAALEQREIFSIHAEIRLLLFAAVSLLVGGVSILVAENIDRIGHLTLIAAITVASAVCYGLAWRSRFRAPSESNREEWSGAPGEYLLLLAASLLSAAVGYAEARYRILGDAWTWHLLILAMVHTATAYLFGSRLVLSLAVTGYAAWLGIDREGEILSGPALESGLRLLILSTFLVMWRTAHVQLLPDEAEGRGHVSFPPILDQFAAHAAFVAALIWVFDEGMEYAGLTLLTVVASLSVLWGIRKRRELFVVYGLIYGVIGVDTFMIERLDDETLIYLWLLLTTPVAITLLFLIHFRWSRDW